LIYYKEVLYILLDKLLALGRSLIFKVVITSIEELIRIIDLGFTVLTSRFKEES